MIKGLLLGLSLFVLSAANAKELDYRVDNGVFHTSEGAIPNGCFGQLITEFNGDNTVAAVYVNRANLRGCIAANLPYPGGEKDDISYRIAKQLGDHKFYLLVCQTFREGSLSGSCNRIIIQFRNREYLLPKEVRSVLVMEKLGEW